MFDIRYINPDRVERMYETYHGYRKGAGYGVYSFAVYEGEKVVAHYLFKQAIAGLAKSVSPVNPQSVLSLSRMVALPKSERKLKHISKPLMYIIKREIDQKKYRHIVTFSDRSLGHNGYVYQCCGFKQNGITYSEVWEDYMGRRTCPSSSGKSVREALTKKGHAILDRWEYHYV